MNGPWGELSDFVPSPNLRYFGRIILGFLVKEGIKDAFTVAEREVHTVKKQTNLHTGEYSDGCQSDVFEETMEAADWIIDIGPGAGLLGGQVIAEGTPAQIKKSRASITGKFLSGKEVIEVPATRRRPENGFLKIIGASENNLQNITAEIRQKIRIT